MNNPTREKESNFVSAVVYMHNSEAHIVQFLSSLTEVLGGKFAHYEVICVNDASDDNSADLVRSMAGCEGGSISLINMSYYQGVEAAMNAGVDLSIGDYVYEFDSCLLSYEPSLISDVYDHMLKGYDIVSAVPGRNRISSRIFYNLFNKHAHYQYKITSETFRILSRRAINRIHSMSRTIPYRKALYANCGLCIDSIKYTPVKGLDSASKNANSQQMRTAIDSLIIFTNVGYKFASVLTGIMMLASFLEIVYTVAIYLLGKPIEGYTTTMLVLTLGLFGVFAVLAVVIKYLSILVDLIYKEQKYVVESIEKISKQGDSN